MVKLPKRGTSFLKMKYRHCADINKIEKQTEAKRGNSLRTLAGLNTRLPCNRTLLLETTPHTASRSTSKLCRATSAFPYRNM